MLTVSFVYSSFFIVGILFVRLFADAKLFKEKFIEAREIVKAKKLEGEEEVTKQLAELDVSKDEEE